MAGKRQRLLSEVASVQPGRSKLDDRTDKVRESVSSKKTKRNNEDLQINDQQIPAVIPTYSQYVVANGVIPASLALCKMISAHTELKTVCFFVSDCSRRLKSRGSQG